MSDEEKEFSSDDLDKAREGVLFILKELNKNGGKADYQPVYSALHSQFGSRIGNLADWMASKNGLIERKHELNGAFGVIKSGLLASIFGSDTVMAEITEKGKQVLQSQAPARAVQAFKFP